MDSVASAGVGAAIVAVIGGVTAAIIKLSNQRHKHSKSERLDTLRDYKDLLNRLSRDNEDMKEELNEIRKRLAEVEDQQRECDRHRSRAYDHIQQLESVLTDAGIKFRPWSPHEQ